jgi:proton glutamate symport protein
VNPCRLGDEHRGERKVERGAVEVETVPRRHHERDDLSLASVFVAQAAGIHMGFGQQLLMVFTLMLTSKGVAGVPRASLVILLGTAASFHLPVEPIFIILGIDELMDMARTSTNVLGNCLATVVVARWEGEFGKDHPSAVVQEALTD